MSSFPIPDEALPNNIAVLGKTGAGKTNVIKGELEHIVEMGNASGAPPTRACVLDPIKSDYWGLTSSASGKRPGLPFQILGGPHGHVPLHPSSGAAVAEIVASGALPLSILDMSEFEPGDHARFFVDFSKTLFKKIRGVVHLVIDEAHIFAPKERVMGSESMSVHWANRIATAGRSKGIRSIVATQRTQSLHNAVLGSCETLVALRLTYPADQKPVQDWLRAGIKDKAVVKEIESDLAGLKNGEAWVISGELNIAKRAQFPLCKTFDNSKTPTGAEMLIVPTAAPVDVNKLRSILGEAVVEAEANDPKALKGTIAQLRAELAKKPVLAPPAAPAAQAKPIDNTAALANARAAGREEGYLVGHYVASGLYPVAIKWAVDHAESAIKQFRDELIGSIGEGQGMCQAQEFGTEKAGFTGAGGEKLLKKLRAEKREPNAMPLDEPLVQLAAAVDQALVKIIRPAAIVPASQLVGAVHAGSRSRQNILDALAWWESIGRRECDKTVLAFLAGKSASSSGFQNDLGALRTAGAVEYPQGGFVQLTDLGRASANRPNSPLDSEALQQAIREKLDPPLRAIFDQTLALGRHKTISKEYLAEALGKSATSSGFQNNLGRMRSLGLIKYPSPGMVAPSELVFID